MRFGELRKLVDQLLAAPAPVGLAPGEWVDVNTTSPALFPTATPEVLIPNSDLPDGPIEFECTFVRGANAEAGNSLQLSDTWSGEMWDKTDLLPSTVASTTSRLHAIGVTDPNPGGGLHLQANGDMTGCTTSRCRYRALT
jgi:hypothetical protein